MELILIRHAQSGNNALASQLDRVSDPDLTALGRQQAERLATYLAEGQEPWPPLGSNPRRPGFHIDRLYCSPMWRSLLTAQPVSRALGLTPEVWVDIHEHGGIFLDHRENGGIRGYPGKTRQEILAEFPGYRLPAEVTEQGWWRGSFEEWPACYERACRVAEVLRGWTEREERIALITHGAFLDALLKALLHGAPQRDCFYHYLNTAISRLDFRTDRDGRVDMRYSNFVGHLPAEMLT